MARPWSQIAAEILDAARKQAPFNAETNDDELRRRLSVASPLVQGALISAVRARDVVQPLFLPVVVRRGGRAATFYVAHDDLRIGTAADACYPCVSQLTAQTMADALGARVASALILDALAAQAEIPIDVMGNKLPPRRFDGTQGTDLIRPITSSFGAMEEESERLHSLVLRGSPQSASRLVGPGGKAWIPDGRLNNLAALKAAAAASKWPYYGRETGVNYGFFSRSAPSPPVSSVPPWRVYQRPGIAHDWRHADYSQRGPRLVALACELDGYPTTVDELALELAPELYHYGVGGPPRHPWVPWCGSGPAPPGAIGGSSLEDGAVCYVSGSGAELAKSAPAGVAPWYMMAVGVVAAGSFTARDFVERLRKGR